jgi:hypothetical protein
VLEADSCAKVQMRRKVRGLRTIEREVLPERRTPEPSPLLEARSEGTRSAAVRADEGAQDVVLEYCAAVRGTLNDDQGGPLHPPGLRMAEALERLLQTKPLISIPDASRQGRSMNVCSAARPSRFDARWRPGYNTMA